MAQDPRKHGVPGRNLRVGITSIIFFRQCSHNRSCAKSPNLQVRAAVRHWSERFFRFWYVVSTTQGDLGHVVRSSVGCLGSEIF